MEDRTERPITGFLEAASELAAIDTARCERDRAPDIDAIVAESESRAKARRRRRKVAAYASIAAAVVAAIGLGGFGAARQELLEATNESVAILFEPASDISSFVDAAFPRFGNDVSSPETGIASDTQEVVDALWAESDSWSALSLEASFTAP